MSDTEEVTVTREQQSDAFQTAGKTLSGLFAPLGLNYMVIIWPHDCPHMAGFIGPVANTEAVKNEMTAAAATAMLRFHTEEPDETERPTN